MTTLKQAQKEGKLEEFIKEHEKDKKGDSDRLKKTVENLVQNKSKPNQGKKV
jgi:hypothetical protein